MTCIVGLKHDGKVYLGADSVGVAGYSVSLRKDEKIFQNGPFIFGFTGSFRVGQVLRYSLTLPKYDDRNDIEEYMVNDFILTIRATFERCGCLRKDQGIDYGATFLVGNSINNELYCVESDFQVGKNIDNYNAIGAGADIALGSLYSTETVNKMRPEKRIITALESAEKYSGAVRGPFNVISV